MARGDVGNPDQTYWYVDVLSSQWIGVPIASFQARGDRVASAITAFTSWVARATVIGRLRAHLLG